MANTVSLCLICKNENSNLGYLMEDVGPVLEEVHVTDTGSTDGTLEILQEKQKKYSNLHLHHYTWTDHFSEARNYSFTKAGNVDWIFWLDSDDRINQNDLKHFKDNILDNPCVDCWLLPYIYSKYPDGSPQMYLTRERFLRKSIRPQWIGAIHETVAIHNMRQVNYENLKVEHNRDGKFIEPKRNIRILEKEFQKNPNEPRTAYYFAKELFDHMDPRAKDKLIHYLNIPGDCRYWDDEIGARFRLAKQYLSENNFRQAIQTIEFVYHLDATRKRSEYYYIFGEVESRLGNYEIAIDWYKRCLYDPPGPPRVLSLEYWTWNPMRRLAECYKTLGKWDEVFEYANKVAAILPGDPGTKDWVKNLSSYTLHSKNNGLVVLEFGTNLRDDSYKMYIDNFKVSLGVEPISTVKWFFTKNMPFLSGCIDGIVFDPNLFTDISIEELARVIKPGGFLWHLEKAPKEVDVVGANKEVWFNFLGSAIYKGVKLYTYVRIDETKPSIGYHMYGPDTLDFGGYRHRIHNLVMSAKKKGHPVYNLNERLFDVDIYVDMLMARRYGKINILEFCEKLDGYSCHIENADVLDACSPLLADHLRDKFPDKVVINVDDHFDIPAVDWCV